MYKPTGFIALPMLGLLVLVAAAIAIGSWWIAGKEEAAAPTISNFAECAAAGNAIMESYPRQCAANGQTFVEVIANANGNSDAIVNVNTSANTGSSLHLIKTIRSSEDHSPYNFVISGNSLYVAEGEKGLYIYDITSPENLKFVGSYIPASGERYYNVAVSGKVAALTSLEMSMGPLFIDISDPTNPVLLAENNDKLSGGVIESITMQNNFAYYTREHSGLEILDISDPKNPKLQSILDTPGKPTDIVVREGIAYIGDSRLYNQPGQMIIVDVSDPKKPVQLSSTVTGGKAESLAVDGDYAYIANSSDGGVKIYNISNPKKPVVVGSIKDIVAEDVYVVDGKLFVATRTSKIAVYDIVDPNNPKLLASSYENAKARYIVATGSTVFVADLPIGLYDPRGINVFQLNSDTSPNLTAGWKTYTNTKYGFSLKYPSNYSISVDSTDAAHFYLGIGDPKYDNQPDGNPDAYILTVDDTTMQSLDTWFSDAYSDRQSDQLSGLLTKKATTFHGNAALEIEDGMTIGGCYGSKIAILQNGKVFQMTNPECNGETVIANSLTFAK